MLCQVEVFLNYLKTLSISLYRLLCLHQISHNKETKRLSVSLCYRSSDTGLVIDEFP